MEDPTGDDGDQNDLQLSCFWWFMEAEEWGGMILDFYSDCGQPREPWVKSAPAGRVDGQDAPGLWTAVCLEMATASFPTRGRTGDLRCLRPPARC